MSIPNDNIDLFKIFKPSLNRVFSKFGLFRNTLNISTFLNKTTERLSSIQIPINKKSQNSDNIGIAVAIASSAIQNSIQLNTLLKSSLDKTISGVVLFKNALNVTKILNDGIKRSINIKIQKQTDLTPVSIDKEQHHQPESDNSDIGIATAIAATATANNAIIPEKPESDNSDIGIATAIATINEKHQRIYSDNTDVGIATAIATKEKQHSQTNKQDNANIDASVAIATTLASNEQSAFPTSLSQQNDIDQISMDSKIYSNIHDNYQTEIGIATAISLNKQGFNDDKNVFDLSVLLKMSLNRVLSRIILFKNTFNVTNMLIASITRANKIQIPKNKNDLDNAGVAVAIALNTPQNETKDKGLDNAGVAVAIALNTPQNETKDKGLDYASIAVAIASMTEQDPSLVELIRAAIEPVYSKTILENNTTEYDKYINGIIDKITLNKINMEYNKQTTYSEITAIPNAFGEKYDRRHVRDSLIYLYARIFNILKRDIKKYNNFIIIIFNLFNIVEQPTTNSNDISVHSDQSEEDDYEI